MVERWMLTLYNRFQIYITKKEKGKSSLTKRSSIQKQEFGGESAETYLYIISSYGTIGSKRKGKI